MHEEKELMAWTPFFLTSLCRGEKQIQWLGVQVNVIQLKVSAELSADAEPCMRSFSGYGIGTDMKYLELINIGWNKKRGHSKARGK